MWNCPQCGYFNDDQEGKCISCGRSRDDSYGGVHPDSGISPDAESSTLTGITHNENQKESSPVPSLHDYTSPDGTINNGDIKDYLIWSILMIVFCCLPFGVGGLIFSIKARDYKKAGNWEAAQNSSKNARLCLWAGLLGGVAINILLVLSGVVSELAGSM